MTKWLLALALVLGGLPTEAVCVQPMLRIGRVEGRLFGKESGGSVPLDTGLATLRSVAPPQAIVETQVVRPDGWFRFETLKKGKYWLEIQTPGLPPGGVEVLVGAKPSVLPNRRVIVATLGLGPSGCNGTTFELTTADVAAKK